MPSLPEIVLFADDAGCCPVLSALDAAPAVVQRRCLARLLVLQELSSAFVSSQSNEREIEYFRIGFDSSYFFVIYYLNGSKLLLLHAVISISELVLEDLAVATRRKRQFNANPEAHTYGESRS